MPKKISNKKQKENKEQTSKNSKKLTLEEFEKKVLELAGKGFTAEKIGENLRGQGIHPKEYGKKISVILKENGKYIPHDIINLEEKLRRIDIHYKKNKQDKKAMRERDRVFSMVRRIKEYHKAFT